MDGTPEVIEVDDPPTVVTSTQYRVDWQEKDGFHFGSYISHDKAMTRFQALTQMPTTVRAWLRAHTVIEDTRLEYRA